MRVLGGGALSKVSALPQRGRASSQWGRDSPVWGRTFFEQVQASPNKGRPSPYSYGSLSEKGGGPSQEGKSLSRVGKDPSLLGKRPTLLGRDSSPLV
jgi:hypothetical protein